MTIDQLQKVLQRFPPPAGLLVSLGGVDYAVDHVEIVLPEHIPVDGSKNLGWAEIVSEAVKVRIVVTKKSVEGLAAQGADLAARRNAGVEEALR